jgi:hypothetical protein
MSRRAFRIAGSLPRSLLDPLAVGPVGHDLFGSLNRRSIFCPGASGMGWRRERRTALSQTPATEASSTLYFGPCTGGRRFRVDAGSGCSPRHLQPHVPSGVLRRPGQGVLGAGTTSRSGTGVERVVQISGPDGFELTNMITCRDLNKCGGPGQVRPDHRPRRRIVNDPVPLRRDENTFWLCPPTATRTCTRWAWRRAGVRTPPSRCLRSTRCKCRAEVKDLMTKLVGPRS